MCVYVLLMLYLDFGLHFLKQRNSYSYLWKELFAKFVLKISIGKATVMWVEKQRCELNSRWEREDIKEIKDCMHLGGSVSKNESSVWMWR